MARRLLVAFSACLLILAAGCGKQIPVNVENTLGYWEITELRFSTEDAEGDNLLAEALQPGARVEVSVAPGTYEVVAIDAEDGIYELDFTVPEEGAASLTIGAENRDSYDETTEVAEGVYATGDGSAAVRITNDLGDWDIYFIYIDPSDEPWGEDRLGSEILAQGETLITLVDPGVYDIQVEDIDGDTYTKWGVDVGTDGYEWSVTLEDIDSDAIGGFTTEISEGVYETGDGDSPITVINDLGDYTIWYLYVDPSVSPWGDDRLGAYLLEPGHQITVWVDAGTYDIKAEDEDMDTYTQREVEVDPEGYEWSVTLEDMD